MQYREVLKEKQRVEQALKAAMEYTAKEYATVIYASLEQKEKVVERVFTETFSVLMGAGKEENIWEMYLPVLILVEEDGMVFYHIRELKTNGVMEYKHQWTDKVYFEFMEGCTEAEKRTEVIERLEQETSRYITNHNYIADQYGISYTFFVPRFMDTEGEKLNFPMIFAVFQGWPLTASGGITYENCIDVGVYLQERRRYVLEMPVDIQYPFYCYHEVSCIKYSLGSNRFLEEEVTEEEAISQYGAFPCELCIQGL